MAKVLLDIDVAVALLILLVAIKARWNGQRQAWNLFWTGVCLGLVWEVGFFLKGPWASSNPAYLMAEPFPLAPGLQPVVHAIWDGGLFMIGLWIVDAVCKAPTFQRFRLAEVLTLVVWGNLQELGVELLATGGGLWTFVPTPYNPLLFRFGDGYITLLPQLIWTIAPGIFYVAALRSRRRSSPSGAIPIA